MPGPLYDKLVGQSLKIYEKDKKISETLKTPILKDTWSNW